MNKTDFITFTYTKDSGEVSDRMGITLGYSSPKLALIADITDYLLNENLIDVKNELEKLRKEYLYHVDMLLKENEIQQKTFKLSGITNEKKVNI